MQEDLRKLKKRTGEASDSESDTSSTRRKRRKGRSFLDEELAKYTTGRGRAAARSGNKKGRRDEEEDILLEMGKFSKRVAQQTDRDDERGDAEADGLEVDNDVGWMKHRLKFEVDEKELTRRAEDEYSVSQIQAELTDR